MASAQASAVKKQGHKDEADFDNAMKAFLKARGRENGPTSVHKSSPLGKKDGFHAFRRFRTTHLRTEGVPEDFVMFWLGHKEKTITDRYSKMKERLELRRRWAEKAGVGFKLPAEKVVTMAVKPTKKESAA
jgi:integrase